LNTQALACTGCICNSTSQPPTMSSGPIYNVHKGILSGLEKYAPLFPGALTFFSLSVFSSPIISSWDLYNDVSIRYWIGDASIVAFICVPLLVILCHVGTLALRRPSFHLVLLGTMLPAIIMLVVGYMHYTPLGGITSRLLSTDCVTFEEKFNLETAYRVANNVFEDCAARGSNVTSMNPNDIKRNLLIQDCTNYHDKEYDQFRDRWQYLHQLEKDQDCSGWCYESEINLWTSPHVLRDSCSTTAATALSGKANRLAKRMVFTAFVGVLICGIVLVFAVEIFARFEIAW